MSNCGKYKTFYQYDCVCVCVSAWNLDTKNNISNRSQTRLQIPMNRLITWYYVEIYDVFSYFCGQYTKTAHNINYNKCAVQDCYCEYFCLNVDNNETLPPSGLAS